MRVLRVAAGAVAGLCAVAATPASAQFFLQSKDLAGQPVRGDEPGVIGSPLPDATPAELRVLWLGTTRMLAADGVDDPAEWRRYAALVLDALRA